MSKIFKLIIVLTIFIFISCEKSVLDSYELSDAEIIERIIDSEKIEISLDQLPNSSQSILSQEYAEYMDISCKFAHNLGYQVELAGLGHRSGHRNEVYFNIKGRKLDSIVWGDERGWKKWDSDKNHGRDWRCFELVFPITYEMPDGTNIVVIDDSESGWSAVKSWFASNARSEDKPEVRFPISITIREQIVILENSDDLRDAYANCNYSSDDENLSENRICFELVYPVSYLMPDGTSIEASSDDEFGWSEIKNWFNNNSDFEIQIPEIEYPVDIVYNDQELIITINNKEEMYDAKADCQNKWEEKYFGDCFDLLFPITFEMPDGTTISVENDDEHLEIENWYLENSDLNEKPFLIYPVSIMYNNDVEDSIVIIESQEDMIIREELCWNTDYSMEDQDDNQHDCYTFIYPISFQMPDGSELVIDADDEQGWYALSTWYELNPEYEQEPTLIFPINILLQNEDENYQLAISNYEDLETAEQNCEE